MSRPALNNQISITDFTDFYWLKAELTAFCKTQDMATTGSKLELAERIKHFLATGEKIELLKPEAIKPISVFNWNTATLSLATLLTDNYKSTENVRRFFTAQIGPHFRFTVSFMKWITENMGKTLAEATTEWTRQHDQKKDANYQSEIAPQFEYNRYMRAFLADNPDRTNADAMKFWKLKRALRGAKEYAKSDLLLSSS